MDAYTPKPDTWDDLAKKYGVSLPSVSTGSDVSDLLHRMRQGAFSQESSGDYNVKPNARTGAVGGFQVLPSNIPSWTEAHYHKRLTPEQFQSDPKAQEAVFSGQMGQYLKKARTSSPDDDTAIRKAAAMWYGGEGAADRYDDPTRFRSDEPSFREYTTGVLNKSKPQRPVIDFDALSSRYGVADNKGGQPVSPTVATQQTIQTPVPESTPTIEAQLRSTND